jgi:glyoxylate reductase
MTQTIYFGAQLPGRPEAALEGQPQFELIVPSQETVSQQTLAAAAPEADALITLLSHTIDDTLLAKCPRLKIVSNYAVGFNNIDIEAATRRGVVVTNTPDVLTETTADLAWALLMAAARRIPEADRFMRADRFKGWKPSLLLGHDVHEKILGVIGFGRIGQAVARRALGFRMRVLYFDPHVGDISLEGGPWVEEVGLSPLLEKADFISIHCPLNASTRHLIGPQEFKKMKSTAVLINSARGPIIDEAALVEALQQRQIAAAGLDVYEREPVMHPGLAALENVVLAPHIGSGSNETRIEMARMAVAAVADRLAGKRPRHVVNPEVL